MGGTGKNLSFSSNYMLLRPQDATVFDLIRLLFSSNLSNRKFIDCPEGTRYPFAPRWVIVVTTVLQWIFKLFAGFWAWLGSVVEFWLNLLYCNSNIIALIFNIFRGKLVVPDRESSDFASFIGFLDKRLDLDKRISREDRRYQLALCMMASKEAYENKGHIENTVKYHWKMDFVGAYDFLNVHLKDSHTQAFIFQDKTPDQHLIVLAFRGTEPFNMLDWATDIDLSWYDIPKVGRVHIGFMRALGFPPEGTNRDATAYSSLTQTLRKLLEENPSAKLVVTGHSLGGALAALFPAALFINQEAALLEKLAAVYTYGQPRVGDERFGEYMSGKLEEYEVDYYRFVYCNDAVPRVPFDNASFGFKHFGSCLYSNSFYKVRNVAEVPNKNHSLRYFIPMILNAVWELVRSFIIPITRGREYKEGGVTFLARLLGLVFPVVSAHCPQDYVNATRIASQNIFGDSEDGDGDDDDEEITKMLIV